MIMTAEEKLLRSDQFFKSYLVEHIMFSQMTLKHIPDIIFWNFWRQANATFGQRDDEF